MAVTRLCFLLFCLFLVSVSPVKKLDNIENLRNIDYAKSEPRHGRQLLFWFAQNVNVSQKNNFHSKFNPRRGDYGFHRFGNRERLLPSLSAGESYYEVGDLNLESNPGASALPPYVQRYYRNTNLPEKNMDRLIVSVHPNTPYRIFSVFITAHNRGRHDFNRSDTYELDPALISQIRQTYGASQSKRSHDERCSQFLQHTGYNDNGCKRKRCSAHSQREVFEGTTLEIQTTTEGYAKIVWKNISADVMTTSKFVYIDICQSTSSNADRTLVRKQYFRITESSGALNTSVYLNAGLQLQLRLYVRYFSPAVRWCGPQFDGAHRVLPVTIKGCDASLQLCVKDGRACARLYISKTFSNWKHVLYHSWVGFYKSSGVKNHGYYTYQYVERFTVIDNTTIGGYDIYQYDSSLTIAPGVQIRFLLDKNYDKVLARTTPWEADEELTTLPSNCIEGNLASSPWAFPQFLNEPELYNVIAVRIGWYDAYMYLFDIDGKACARLYIKQSFTNWENTFYYSWVGFYSSPQAENKDYETYQWAVYFEKTQHVRDVDIYEYNSGLTIANGMQIRFLMDSGYDKEIAKTQPWRG